jgi:hemerythrin-like domain-containing protein
MSCVSLLHQSAPYQTLKHSKQNDHAAHFIANEMACAHNAMLRGLNAIYLQAPHIPKSEIPDFLLFVASYTAWVMHHHKLEEEKMFPCFQSVPEVKPGSLEVNIDQHHTFSERLASLNSYATTVNVADYSGAHVREIVEAFAKPFREHLADEIQTLWDMDSVEANSPASGYLLHIYALCEVEASKLAKRVVPPMVLGLCDRTFQGGKEWPRMPAVSVYVVHYLFGWRHRRAWKFLPCDTFRNPRPLYRAGEGDN